MSNYSVDPAMCRVDLFKPSGTYYNTLAVKFRDEDYKAVHPQHAFQNAMRDHLKDRPDAYRGMTAVCLHPYVKLQYPLMMEL